MVCLKAHDKSSNMRRTARQLLVNLHWLLIDLRIDLKTIFLKVFIKRIFCYLIETKTSIKTLLWESTKPRPYMYFYCLDWQTWSTFTGFKVLSTSRKTLQHQWEWIGSWIHQHKIDRKNEMQSTQGEGGRKRHSMWWNSGCLQRCCVCVGRVRHQRMVPYQNMCK